MNKTAIKNFAIWARNKLIADIVYQAGLLGVTEKGIASALPQSTREVQFFDIGTKDYMTVRGKAVQQRDAFVAAIKAKQSDTDYASAFRFVVEKVAYTWFNRLIAIRFMEVNDYLPGRVRVLSSENPGKAEPDMVTRPFDTDLPFSTQEQDEIMRMKDENKLDELFRMLFIMQCHKLHEVLPNLFEEGGIQRADSYLELLLTISFTDKDGVLWHLTHDISEDDFNVEKEGQVEIIGWMYQYYNTEPKQQVFDNLKKNIKISKDNIPAATQLFTPDWIVRYMVENSLGRLWVEGHPNEELKKNWKYYLEEAEQEPQVQAKLADIRKQYAALRPEEIKVIDPCMGSGHILVYLFDVLMQIYESQGWTQREAAQSIVQNKLFGLDIDDRAAQLAYFAVMMKARQYDRRFLERGIVPRVFGIQESNGINREQVKLLGRGMSDLEKNNAINHLNEILDALLDAKEYGSILNVPELDWDLLRRFASEIDESGQISLASIGVDEVLKFVRGLIDQAQAMGQKYHAVVTNPPYMGSTGMSPILTQYIKDNYFDSKSDLFAVCLEHGFSMLKPNGFEAMITMESWMFLSSFEKMRTQLIRRNNIVNLVHMPYLGKGGTSLGINFGTDMAVIRNVWVANYVGTYDRIAYFETDENGIPFKFPTCNKFYKKITQDKFSKLPGSPVAYWLSDDTLGLFSGRLLGQVLSPRQGVKTLDNNRFVRLWYEPDFGKIGMNASSLTEANKMKRKWFPYTKGGDFRKWYGNRDCVVNWEDDGREMKELAVEKYNSVTRTITNIPNFFRAGLTWSDISTASIAIRYAPKGAIFDSTGVMAYGEEEELQYIIALLNSCVSMYFLRVFAPSLHFNGGAICNIPYIYNESYASLVKELA